MHPLAAERSFRCHTLKAGNSGGTQGPNLDEVLPGQSAAMITESIEDPESVIAKGYPANVMPSNFGQTLTPPQLQQLATYLQTTVNGGGGGGGGTK